MTLNHFFAVLLGVVALVALASAARRWGGSAGDRSNVWGWVALAVAASLQVVNLLSDYSWLLSVVTTVGLLAGSWLVTRGGRVAPSP